jgi:rhizosphere induced protein
MAEQYYVDFINNSGRTWTMGVYQTLPESVGLESVAWQQTTVANGGESGVEWAVDYVALLSSYRQTGGKGVYKASQKLPTSLGTRWKIVYKEGLQQLEPDGTADRPDQIIIFNDSGELANPGIGMSNEGSVYKRDVLSGSGGQFVVTPTYWVGLFNDLVRGQVISSNVVVGPEKLVFPSGFNQATVTATLDGSSLKLKVAYGRLTMISTDLVEARLTALQRYQGRGGAADDVGQTNGTLAMNKVHKWDRNQYTTLSIGWSGAAGNGKCSVKLGDRAQSYNVPTQGIAIDNQAGSLTNNTDKTISYSLD